jgi:hypothetical protein
VVGGRASLRVCAFVASWPRPFAAQRGGHGYFNRLLSVADGFADGTEGEVRLRVLGELGFACVEIAGGIAEAGEAAADLRVDEAEWRLRGTELRGLTDLTYIRPSNGDRGR